MNNSELKYIAASLILAQLPKGRAIDDQTLMLEASAAVASLDPYSGDEWFSAPEADELLRRLDKVKDVEIIQQRGAERFVQNSINYFIWKRR